MAELKYVGKEIPRLIAQDMVRGKAIFTGDIKVANMAYGRVLRSPHPHAEIVRIDASAAEAMPGVHAVVTYKDVPADCFLTNGMSPARHAKPLDKKVRYIGDAVALVVADSEDIADEAIEKVDVEYKVLPAALTIDEALAEDAPQIYEQLPGNVAPLTFFLVDNLDYETGDLEKGFADADIIIDLDTELTSGQNPLTAEAPTIIASWDGEGVLHFYASCAAPSYTAFNVANSLNMPYERIHVEAPCCGGSFGSKLFMGNVYPLLFAALMAKKADRPVLYAMTKEEHLAANQTRMSMKANIKLGVKKDGTSTAIALRQWCEAGVAATCQENMMSVGGISLTMLSRSRNIRYKGDVVITNRVPSGTFRGYGYMETTAIITRAICRACRELDIDPVRYFEVNALKQGGQYYNSLAVGREWQVSVSPDWDVLVRETAKKFRWDERFKGWGVPTKIDGHKRRGVGCALCGQSDLGGMAANTNIMINNGCGVIVQTTMNEHGTGVRDTYRKLVAEELDIPLEKVTIAKADTQGAPSDFGSMAARSTYAGGMTAILACRDLKEKLCKQAEKRLNVPADDWEFVGGKMRRKSNGEEHILPEILIAPNSLTGTGHWDGVENANVCNMQFVEVEVDIETGVVSLIDQMSGVDAGKVVNPLGLKNQVESFYPGIDMALMEETVWDSNDNRILTANMVDYKTRTFNDVAHHDMVVLESFKDKESVFPFGAMGIAEPCMTPSGPAVQMALYNATGVEVLEYPFTPQRVLAALKKKEECK
ncbi:MAG: xanthine dehydrogenase family protein molybdopterin-binding subunit [Synergistaceae bacterium]|jgi:xanthine dehydrogenase molybdenum-binding subunit|nr:xanthine dehydrogenase family protein molybdopterin-binding subunit [Synergistaceae bacterium]